MGRKLAISFLSFYSFLFYSFVSLPPSLLFFVLFPYLLAPYTSLLSSALLFVLLTNTNSVEKSMAATTSGFESDMLEIVLSCRYQRWASITQSRPFTIDSRMHIRQSITYKTEMVLVPSCEVRLPQGSRWYRNMDK